MMSFEEQFPELKDEEWSGFFIKKQCMADDISIMANQEDNTNNWHFIEVHHIQQHCLSKQRVKEAFEIFEKDINNHTYQELKNDLGLEEE